MFSFLKFFKRTKKIVFIDGDQPLISILAAHKAHCAGIQSTLVRHQGDDSGVPKVLRNELEGIDKIYLTGYTAGKEVTDKFIAAAIQKCVSTGYSEITVISSDADFLDIFKMIRVINPTSKVLFKMIVPKRNKVAFNMANSQDTEIIFT